MPNALLDCDLVLVDALHRHDPALAVILDFHLRQPFLLVHYLILHPVLLLDLKVHVPFLLVVLGPDDLGLLGFLLLGEEDSFLDFAFLVLALLVQHVVLLGHVPLPFVLHLVVEDFLKE